MRLAFTLGLALLVMSAHAAAQDPKAQAKEFYNFGARAFEAGQFRAAAKAFEEAYRLVPKPPLLFSAGQALRRQFAVDHKPDDLTGAIGYYRRYLTEMKEGGRRAEAAAALADLEPNAERMGVDPAAKAPPERETAAIMVSSNVKNVQATLDGKAVGWPLSEEVQPGKHVIRLRAPGCFDVEREVQVAPRSSFLVDIPLKRKPARLSIKTQSTAEVMLDGTTVGATPLTQPLEVEPGYRRLVLLRTGHQPYVTDLDLEADRAETVTADFALTKQRYAAHVLIGVGVASVLTGGVFTGLAFWQQGNAIDIDEARQQGNINDGDREEFDDAIGRRDAFRLAATVSFAGGALIGLTGVLLWVFDSPQVADPRAPRRPDKPEPKQSPETVDMSFSPAGASLRISF